MPEPTFDSKNPKDVAQGCLGCGLIALLVVFVAGLLAPDSEPEAQVAPPSSPHSVVQEEPPEPKPSPDIPDPPAKQVPQLDIAGLVNVTPMYISDDVRVKNSTGHVLTGVQISLYPSLSAIEEADSLRDLMGTPADAWRNFDLLEIPTGRTLIPSDSFTRRDVPFAVYEHGCDVVMLASDQGVAVWKMPFAGLGDSK